MNQHQELRKQVEKQANRMRKARQEQNTLLSQTIYLSTLGLLFIVPVIGGAYLGLWLDKMQEDYSVLWTASLLLLGLIIGVMNVYLFIRE
ncbi:MAG: AtpZ/AtpI family protein [Gammaproteobacteria bacterium]|nr:AtpZ/AtpI family protein [Gammaproteobacteria bacterium]